MRAAGHVVVIGGANLDILARSASDAILATSNPGEVRMSAGGVGRNIAENLARLGTPTHLVADLGLDPAGDQVWEATEAAGVHMRLVRRTSRPTGRYVATIDGAGELVVAVAHMEAGDALGVGLVESARADVRGAGFLVLDGNLNPEAVARALEYAGELGVPVILDPVSVPKALLLSSVLSPRRPVHTLTPNRDELAALTGLEVADSPSVEAAARGLLDRGVERVWVRLGERGSLFVDADGARGLRAQAVLGDVVDVTGAGDALLAGYTHALLAARTRAPTRARGDEAAAYGHRVAALTVASRHTVRPDLSPDLLRSAP